MLQYLPTKLAEWIGKSMQDELGFPDKNDPRKWSVSELNDILRTHVFCDRNCCSLQTFGCLEWESELYGTGSHNARQMLSLQDARSSLSQHEPSGILIPLHIYMPNRPAG